LITSPYQKYQQTQLQTAPPAQLLLMLYDGAIRFVRIGISGIDENNYEKANNYLCKTQAVINELIAALNYEYPVANTLYQVYEYMIHQLIQSNVKKNKKPAIEVLDYLVDLREAWFTASKSMSVGPETAK
jgi:flagellar secretion chaperone FliS